jgi:hypothetical protein
VPPWAQKSTVVSTVDGGCGSVPFGKSLSKQLFSELVAAHPENHRMIADARALVTFFEVITKGTHDDDDFHD